MYLGIIHFFYYHFYLDCTSKFLSSFTEYIYSVKEPTRNNTKWAATKSEVLSVRKYNNSLSNCKNLTGDSNLNNHYICAKISMKDRRRW